jgi:hypothetical protein
LREVLRRDFAQVIESTPRINFVARFAIFLSSVFSRVKFFAPKWCKPVQTTEKHVVSPRETTIFHTLINTCVENFTKQKYCDEDSVRRLHKHATNAMTTDAVGLRA